jgi:hypothetical protein
MAEGTKKTFTTGHIVATINESILLFENVWFVLTILQKHCMDYSYLFL